MKYLTLLFFSNLVQHSHAQNRTNIWELGYQISLNYSNCEMRYINSEMDTNSISRIMAFTTTNTSICDTMGNLLFYSNGQTIGNSEYDTLYNAINFNPGSATDNSEPEGMKNSQGVLIIPDPGNYKRYYLFHESGEYFIANNIFELQPMHLSYSIVDMNLDNGLGGILEGSKNIIILEDTLTWGGLTACKHANGRDWWVIFHRYYSDSYYKLLITPNGVEGPWTQSIGLKITSDVVIQTSFSPDGSKYCFTNFDGGVDYFQFDRCSGEFYDPISFINPDSFACRGNSFSPNGRFLYVSTLINLYQYDTWNTNMVENSIHLATWDTFYDNTIPVYFFMHQLAPDNKIFMSSWNGVKYLNVINSPDNLGLSCNFAPHSYILPTWTWNIPSFPNYDLGAIDGSPCDTLYLNSNNQQSDLTSFRISPNPASDWFNIVYETNPEIIVTITNEIGHELQRFTLYPWFKNRIVYTDKLAPGIYLLTFTGKDLRESKKLIIQH